MQMARRSDVPNHQSIERVGPGRRLRREQTLAGCNRTESICKCRWRSGCTLRSSGLVRGSRSTTGIDSNVPESVYKQKAPWRQSIRHSLLEDVHPGSPNSAEALLTGVSVSLAALRIYIKNVSANRGVFSWYITATMFMVELMQ